MGYYLPDCLAYCIGTGTPVHLEGEPGIGKTSIVEQIAALMAIPIETLIASIREPSDFGGLPVIAGETYHLAPPIWARRIAKVKRGILFFDELRTAPPAVQAAVLRVVLDRVVGELELPSGISIVAASNPVEQSAGGWELSAPLANRFVHLRWGVDIPSWADGLAAGRWEAPRVPALPEDWEQSYWPISRAKVAAFLRSRPQLALNVPEDESEAGKAWPSPRSWTMKSRLLAACDAGGAGEETKIALGQGSVGEGPSLEYFAWERDLDLPDPEDLLADPAGHPLPLDRGDRAYAVLSAVAAAATREPDVGRWESAWRVLGRAADANHTDVAAQAARTLARNIPGGATAPPEAAAFAPVLRAAGLMS